MAYAGASLPFFGFYAYVYALLNVTVVILITLSPTSGTSQRSTLQFSILLRSQLTIDPTASTFKGVLKSLLPGKVEPCRRPCDELPQLVRTAKLTDTANGSLEVSFYKRAHPSMTAKEDRHIDPVSAGTRVASTLTTWPVAKVNGQGTPAADS
jgi:hypothetical protein